MNDALETSAPPKRRLPGLILLAAALCLVAWLAYQWWWGRSHVSTDNAQVESHIIAVLPKVGGFVTAVKVVDNQAVKAGDLLLTIEDRDFKTRLAQAEAELALALANAGSQGQASGQAAAQVEAARASAAAARSAIEQALANADKAQKDLERTRALVAQKMLSPQALDSAEAAARASLAQVQVNRQSASSAGEQVHASNAALRAALARVDAARAARDLAANQLADTRVVAPVSGMVSNKTVEPNQLVQAGQPLLAVVPLEEVWIVANLKETDIAEVKPGAPASVEVDAYPGLKVDAVVDSISAATGARFSLLPPDNATGNFTKVVQRLPVRLRVKQNADAGHPLRPGMSVFVTVDTK